MAWMRMMGAHSVAYHEHTVAGRGDDPVANALDYYASRGETPMSWGGSGAALLGLEGEVDMADWRALFGAGGPHHPESGERLWPACGRAWSWWSARGSRWPSSGSSAGPKTCTPSWTPKPPPPSSTSTR